MHHSDGVAMDQELDRYLESASELWRSGELEDALELVDTCLTLYPDSVDALAMRGGLLRDLDRPEEAVEALREALRQDPTLAQAAADLADLLIYELDEPDAALGPCERGLQWATEPELRAELHFLAGACLLRMELLEKALEHLNASIGINDRHSHVFRERGFCHFEMWHFEAARSDYERALELDEESSGEPHFYLGILCEREGRWEEATAHFYRAHEIEPEIYPLPRNLSAEEFSAIVERVKKSLPAELQQALEQVTLWIQDYPEFQPSGTTSHNNITPRLLGIYDCTMLHDLDQSWEELPGVLLLFKRNIELYTRNEEEMESEIQATLLHELHHYLELHQPLC